MIYILSDLSEINEEFIEQAMPLLSEQRRERVQQIRHKQGKRQSAAVYLLLRFALINEYGINEPVEFEYGEKGKPVLRDHPHILFNLSHCKNAAACVVSAEEAGVDIQDIRPVTVRVAKRVLTSDEFEVYKKAPEPDAFVCELWTVKESRLKQTGQGIGEEMSSLRADDVQDKTVIKGDGYICCVCGAETQVRYVTVHELINMINQTQV